MGAGSVDLPPPLPVPGRQLPSQVYPAAKNTILESTGLENVQPDPLERGACFQPMTSHSSPSCPFQSEDQVVHLYNLISIRLEHFESEQRRRWDAHEARLEEMLNSGRDDALTGEKAPPEGFCMEVTEGLRGQDVELVPSESAVRHTQGANMLTNEDDAGEFNTMNVACASKDAVNSSEVGLHKQEYMAQLEMFHRMPKWMASSRCVQKLHELRSWYIELEEPQGNRWIDRFVNSNLFSFIITCVILSNILFIVFSTDVALAEARDNDIQPIYDVLAGIGLAYTMTYLVELVLKIISRGRYFFIGNGATWNLFDLFLVMMAILDVVTIYGASASWMRSLRILKATKALRALRVLKFASELRMIMRCVVGSVLALFWSAVMIAFVVFLFGVFFSQETTNTLTSINLGDFEMSDTKRDEMLAAFGSVQLSMLTLFSAVTGGNDWMTTYQVAHSLSRGKLAAAVFLLFFFIFFFSIMNIISAAFIEKALKLAQPDTEELAHLKFYNDIADEHALRKLLQNADLDKDMQISRSEFVKFFDNGDFRRFLQVRDIDIKDARHFFSMVAATTSPEAEVDIGQLVSCVNRIKGYATSVDLHILRFEVRALLKVVKRNQDTIAAMREVVTENSELAKHNAMQLRSARSRQHLQCSPPTSARRATEHDGSKSPV
jgi:hypothetical protein